MPRPKRHTYCNYFGCKNTNAQDKLSFFRLPKDPIRCKAWVDACKNPKLIGISPKQLNSSSRVCSAHFQPWCFMNEVARNSLVHNAVPDAPKPARIKTEPNTDDDQGKIPDDLKSVQSETVQNNASSSTNKTDSKSGTVLEKLLTSALPQREDAASCERLQPPDRSSSKEGVVPSYNVCPSLSKTGRVSGMSSNTLPGASKINCRKYVPPRSLQRVKVEKKKSVTNSSSDQILLAELMITPVSFPPPITIEKTWSENPLFSSPSTANLSSPTLSQDPTVVSTETDLSSKVIVSPEMNSDDNCDVPESSTKVTSVRAKFLIFLKKQEHSSGK